MTNLIYDRIILAPSEYFTNDTLRDVLGITDAGDGSAESCTYLGTVPSAAAGIELHPGATEGCAPLVPFGNATRAPRGLGWIIEKEEVAR